MCFGGGDGGVKETGDQKELARIGIEQLQTSNSMYPEAEGEFFQAVDNMNSEEYQRRASNSAMTNVSSAYGDAGQRKSRDMNAAGINPNSGRRKSAISGLSSNESVDRMHNANQTQQALQDNYLQGKSNIVAMGMGQESEAIQGFGNIAADSGRMAINDAQRRYGESANRQSAIATGAGIGLSALGRQNGEEND